MPSPITYPLTKGAKYFIRAAGAALTLYEHLFDEWEPDQPDVEWRRAQVLFTRAPSDNALITFDIVNYTNGGIDASWIEADYFTCETAIHNFFLLYAPWMSSSTSLAEVKWYRMRFNPATDSRPFAPSVVPERITNWLATAGTGNIITFPRQVAFVVRETTPFPRHHGRVFLPFDGSDNALNADGQIKTQDVDVIVPSFHAMYNELWASNFAPVVPSIQVQNNVSRFLMPIIGVQGDSTPDIQRKRRSNAPVYERSMALTP